MNIKNNIQIVKLDDQGRGIAYVDNKITFIPNTLIGEVVDIELLKQNSKYNIGRVVNYVKKSDKRIDIVCPYYDLCGGCSLLHMGYSDQLKYKKDKLKNILKKFANIDINIEIIENSNIFGYRNKVELRIVDKLWGYFNNNTHDFISIDKCLLAKESINKVIQYKNYFNINSGTITIRSNYNDEIIISIKTEDKVDIDIDSLKNIIKLVGIIINDKVYYGDSYFIEKFNNKFFKVNYNSFFQVNNEITKEMISILDSNSNGDNLLDLYCGVGFLGQCIKYKYDKIFGIEINENSVLDAIYNAKLNNIDNTYYICGDSSKIAKVSENIDTLFIDPPRTGLVNNLVNDILNINAKRIIYVSCNPVTLARDLNILKDKYNIKKVYLLDMFSQTYHCESICILDGN